MNNKKIDMFVIFSSALLIMLIIAISLSQLLILTITAIIMVIGIHLFARKKIINHETQLYEEKEQIRITLESISDGIITTDSNGNVLHINKFAEEFTGWKSVEAIGKPFFEVFNITNEVTGERAKDPVEEVLTNYKIYQLENYSILTSLGGIKRHIADSAAPIKDINGKITGVVMNFRDVTERKKADSLIRKSEEKFRTIFEQASVGICIMSLEGNFMSANQKCCDILGYSFEELSNMKFNDITYPDDQNISRETVSNLIDATIKTMLFEKRYIRKDGAIIWAVLSASLFRDSEGHPEYFITMIQDNTDRKISEISLVISESRLKRAQSIAHVGNWELDLSNNQVWASDEAFKIYGVEKDSSYMTLEMIQQFTSKICRPKLDLALKLLIEKNEKYDVEFRIFRLSDGEERIMHSNAETENDQNGRPIKIIGVIQDITEHKQAEDMLRENKEKYKKLYVEYQQRQALLVSLIDSIPDLIFYKDNNCVYLGCNKAFEAFAGLEESKITGLTDFDLFDKDMAKLFRTMDLQMMQQGGPRKNEEAVTYPDGNQVFLETLKTPFYDSEGNILGLIGISRDITERKKKEEEILYLNYHDVLTGLYNRTYFDKELKRLDTKRQLPLSVIIGDINGLKLINDAFGHAEGNNLISEMAKILKKHTRKEDIVARTGGDEFCILLPQTDNEVARNILERIKKTCTEYKSKTDNAIYFTSISLGHATKTIETESFDNILQIAEDLMYKRKLLEQKSLHSSIMTNIKTTMFEKSHETQEHAERLATLAKMLGQSLCLTENQIVELELLSTLHDIGKISIDDNILSKPGRLTDDEWLEIKKHPQVGYRIAYAAPELKQIAEYILYHHERWDGKGYPQGLVGEAIPLLSRIIAIVDSYDAMTQDRSYRRAMTMEAAVTEIEKNAGNQFDPVIAEIFVKKVLGAYLG